MTRSNSGFTMIELLIALAVKSLIVGAVLGIMASSSDTYASSSDIGLIQDSGRQAIETIARELRMADVTTLLILPTNGSNSIEFQTTAGYDIENEQPILNSPVQFLVLPSPIDSNRNGEADEGMIVRREGGEDQVLTHFVKAGGFSLQLSNRNLLISVSLEKQDKKGRIAESVLETSIQIRNNTAGLGQE